MKEQFKEIPRMFIRLAQAKIPFNIPFKIHSKEPNASLKKMDDAYFEKFVKTPKALTWKPK